MRARLPTIFILLTVMIDAMGIGLIMPVMPDLLQEVRGAGLANAALVHTPAWTESAVIFPFSRTGTMNRSSGTRR